MINFAAHYLFDGRKLIKNAIVSVENQRKINIEYNDFIIEKSQMFFYNGILIPNFSLKKYSYGDLQNFVEILLQIQENTNDMEKILFEFIMFLQPEDLWFELQNKKRTGFLVLDNIDLQKLTINKKSILKQLF